MNRKCKRCEALLPTEHMRWSRIFHGFLCIDRMKCTENLNKPATPQQMSELSDMIGEAFSLVKTKEQMRELLRILEKNGMQYVAKFTEKDRK